MSRLVQIPIDIGISRVIHVEDGVATKIQILPILPPERMREHLAEELKGKGYEVADGHATKELERDGGKVTVTVDVATGEVTVKLQHEETVKIDHHHVGTTDTDFGEEGRRRVRAEAERAAERKADEAAQRLQEKGTQALEGVLQDLRPEIEQVVHGTTKRALDEKAASLGEVIGKEDDGENLTIKIKV